MAGMATELADLKINETSGVEHGANHAQMGGAEGWLVMKADGTPVAAPSEGTAMADTTTTDATEAEATDAEATDTTETETETTEVEATEADIAKALDDPKLSKTLKAILKAQSAEIAKAREEARVEKDARLSREYVTKAATVKNVGGKPETFGPVLREVAEKCSAATVAELDRVLKAAHEQLATSDLFKTIGHDQAEGGSAYEQLEAHALEIRKADTKLTREQAIAKAAELHPELVAAQRKGL